MTSIPSECAPVASTAARPPAPHRGPAGAHSRGIGTSVYGHVSPA